VLDVKVGTGPDPSSLARLITFPPGSP